MTEPMICVPREWVETYADWAFDRAEYKHEAEVRAFLDKPVAEAAPVYEEFKQAGYFTFCEDKQVWKQGKPKGQEFLHLFTPLYRRDKP